MPAPASSACETSNSITCARFAPTADFKGDGLLDVAVGGGYLSVLLGKSDGTFLPPVTYSAGGYSVIARDLNGDGKPDLALGGSGGISVWSGNGDGTFQPPNYFAASAQSIVAGDFTGPGRAELGGGGHKQRDGLSEY